METMTDRDYADDLALLTNTPAQAKSLLHRLDQFTYFGSNISFTESNINICLVKAWNTIDRLLIIWKSDLLDKIKRDYFQTVVVSI